MKFNNIFYIFILLNKYTFKFVYKLTHIAISWKTIFISSFLINLNVLTIAKLIYLIAFRQYLPISKYIAIISYILISLLQLYFFVIKNKQILFEDNRAKLYGVFIYFIYVFISIGSYIWLIKTNNG